MRQQGGGLERLRGERYYLSVRDMRRAVRWEPIAEILVITARYDCWSGLIGRGRMNAVAEHRTRCPIRARHLLHLDVVAAGAAAYLICVTGLSTMTSRPSGRGRCSALASWPIWGQFQTVWYSVSLCGELPFGSLPHCERKATRATFRLSPWST